MCVCVDFTPKANLREGLNTMIFKPHILKHHIPELLNLDKPCARNGARAQWVSCRDSCARPCWSSETSAGVEHVILSNIYCMLYTLWFMLKLTIVLYDTTLTTLWHDHVGDVQACSAEPFEPTAGHLEAPNQTKPHHPHCCWASSQTE